MSQNRHSKIVHAHGELCEQLILHCDYENKPIVAGLLMVADAIQKLNATLTKLPERARPNGQPEEAS